MDAWRVLFVQAASLLKKGGSLKQGEMEILIPCEQR